MESGQPPHFTWQRSEGRYWRMIDGQRCEIWQNGEEVGVTPGFEWLAKRLLRLDDNLGRLYARFVQDRHLAEAVRHYSGLRLTKNEKWETLVCYICSINRNMPQIRKDVQKLMGEDGWILQAEEISRMDLPSSLGFRKKYLKEAAHMVAEGEVELGRIDKMDYDEAAEELMRLPGVGRKVADCVLLYAYGKGEAFPADVWIKRAMEKLYKVKGERKVGDYARKKWGADAGYAQQYLFEYAREFLRPARKSAPVASGI
jgi:N-glycosylase/DNA lyase